MSFDREDADLHFRKVYNDEWPGLQKALFREGFDIEAVSERDGKMEVWAKQKNSKSVVLSSQVYTETVDLIDRTQAQIAKEENPSEELRELKKEIVQRLEELPHE